MDFLGATNSGDGPYSTFIGGVASLPGAVLGAAYIKGAEWFLPGNWQFLASGVGVLIVLLVLPGGLGGLVTQLRDEGLKAVARRRRLDVPSLLADRAGAEAPPRVSVPSVLDRDDVGVPDGPPAEATLAVTAGPEP